MSDDKKWLEVISHGKDHLTCEVGDGVNDLGDTFVIVLTLQFHVFNVLGIYFQGAFVSKAYSLHLGTKQLTSRFQPQSLLFLANWSVSVHGTLSSGWCVLYPFSSCYTVSLSVCYPGGLTRGRGQLVLWPIHDHFLMICCFTGTWVSHIFAVDVLVLSTLCTLGLKVLELMGVV